jgi:hypothetical protein
VAVRGAEEREGAAAGCGDGRVGFFVVGHGVDEFDFIGKGLC